MIAAAESRAMMMSMGLAFIRMDYFRRFKQ
jgi:hypothetical protein